MTNISIRSGRSSNLPDLLDTIQMDASERTNARLYMQDAEWVAELLCGAGSALRSAAAKAGEGCRTLARRIKSNFGRLSHH